MSNIRDKYPIPVFCEPVYRDVQAFATIANGMVLWDGDGWEAESMSWKESCYIHSGLSGFPTSVISGPDAQKLLSLLCINDVYKWPIHKSKHLVMCNEEGQIVNHALAIRDAEDSFRTFSMPWETYQLSKHPEFDVEIHFIGNFIFQLGGPLSLTVLEAATGVDLHDLGFLENRIIHIEGYDNEFEVGRIGMAGTLAVELRGPIELIEEMYDHVYQAGLPYGIKRLGYRTYQVNHTEGGFPQYNGTFHTALVKDPGFMERFGSFIPSDMTGSINPEDVDARLRTPEECGWLWSAKFNHDFIGREAVEATAANPSKQVVTLHWNKEDFADIFRSLMEDEEPYKVFELPCGQPSPAGGHADLVTKDGKQVGIASAPVYSLYYKTVLALCSIDIDQVEIGNEVIVSWGDYGKRIKEVRATVERYPYLDLEDNRTYDLSKVPSGLKPISK